MVSCIWLPKMGFNVFFFMTHGVGIETWKEAGILTRELLFLSKLSQHKFVNRITIFSYSGNISSQLKLVRSNGEWGCNVEIIQIHRYNVIKNLFVFWKEANKSPRNTVNIFRSNQTKGAGFALLAKIISRKSKFVYRSGYRESAFSWRQRKYIKFVYFIFIELFLELVCDLRISTSLRDAWGFPFKKPYLRQVYNFVADDFFGQDCKDREGMVFVGRADPQKQLPEICEMVSLNGQLKLDVYGVGDFSQLKERFKESRSIAFLGKVSNAELSCLIAKYKYGVLLSSHEGMPKTVLEMMAAGLVVCATRVGNLEDFCRHENNIVFFSKDPAKWPKELARVLGFSTHKYESISNRARETAQMFRIDALVNQEVLDWSRGVS